jgi:dTDP-4-dehydrorhamnose reductase
VRIAVTGAAGRLGRALVEGLGEAPFSGPLGPIGWTRDAFDLDEPAGVGERLDRERIEVVVHAAAWTDVDGCAREPELALRRNGEATAVLARACAERGLDLVVVSTNEVFDGRRTDGRGYDPTDEPAPGNPYGASKLAGERAAREAYAGARGGALGIVRTAWLFGPGKPDFPAKILAAARAAVERGEPLRAVGDEWGSPTYTADVADAIAELLGEAAVDGVHHVVNAETASRADWARDVVARAGLPVEVEDVPSSTWPRPSVAPRWGVLAATPLPSGEPLRPWRQAMADYAPVLLREHAAAAGSGGRR